MGYKWERDQPSNYEGGSPAFGSSKHEPLPQRNIPLAPWLKSRGQGIARRFLAIRKSIV